MQQDLDSVLKNPNALIVIALINKKEGQDLLCRFFPYIAEVPVHG